MSSPTTQDEHGMFRSERLIYRAPEPGDDKGVFKDLTFDRIGYALSSYSNNRLANLNDASDFRKFCAEQCYVGTVICRPVLRPLPPIPTSDESSSSSSSTTKPEPLELVPIGEIHLKNFGANRAHHRNSEIGLQILPAYRQQGFGTEAIRWILHWAFHHTNLHRVGLKTFEGNADAIKCYIKCGFREEGRERQAMWHDGRWQDLILMSILEHEWRDMQTSRR